MVRKKIAIIGGGITGLYLGYHLSQNHQVTIFEKNLKVGGLLASSRLSDWDWSADNFYHHFFSSDRELINLLEELSLAYSFKKPITAIWRKNSIDHFSSPKDLITFPHLNFFDKIRLGGGLGLLKIIPHHRLIPDQEAVKIFPKITGLASYQTIWEPLMRGKFGTHHHQVSAIWLWARIKKRSHRLGYPQGGFVKLVEQLAKKITSSQGKIKTNQIISNFSQLTDFDKLIFTIPKINFEKIINPQRKSTEKTPLFLASLNLILSGSKPILKNDLYWLNIADSSFPFVVMINQAGLVNQKHYGNNYLTYIGGYYSQDDPLLKMSAREVLAKFTPFIKKINPEFEPKSYQAHLFHYLWAQPIVTPGYQKTLPSFTTKHKNIYLVNMEQIYPWDRGINYALGLANKFLKISCSW